LPIKIDIQKAELENRLI